MNQQQTDTRGFISRPGTPTINCNNDAMMIAEGLRHSKLQFTYLIKVKGDKQIRIGRDYQVKSPDEKIVLKELRHEFKHYKFQTSQSFNYKNK